MDFRPAPPFRPNPSLLTVNSFEAIGSQLQVWNYTASAAAYPLANLAFYVPFYVAAPINVQAAFWSNGTGAGGNCDVGIYTDTGTRLVSTGSTGRGAASGYITTTALTDTVVGVGRYYMAFSHDGTNNLTSFAPVAGLNEAAGVLEQTSAFALPSTATFAVTTRAYLPFFGIYAQTIAL
jgi:hypothetical protein